MAESHCCSENLIERLRFDSHRTRRLRLSTTVRTFLSRFQRLSTIFELPSRWVPACDLSETRNSWNDGGLKSIFFTYFAHTHKHPTICAVFVPDSLPLSRLGLMTTGHETNHFQMDLFSCLESHHFSVKTMNLRIRDIFCRCARVY